MRLCVSTVVSADEYMWYIPMFAYSARKAYPKCGIKIFIKGPIDFRIRKNKKLFGDPDLIDNQFLKFPNRRSTCNSLRHLINPKHYRGYDIIYPTDVDFIILPHMKNHVKYYSRIMSGTLTPYAACRGPIKGFKNHPTGVTAWAGKYQRTAAGCSMYKYPEFYTATKEAREYYTGVLSSGNHDDLDTIPSASYREYDEVMLYRICHRSGLRVPGHSNVFINGDKFNSKYRDIHLGDFKFKHRWRNINKMKRILHSENVRLMIALSKSGGWKRVMGFLSGNAPDSIMKIYQNMEKHLEKR